MKRKQKVNHFVWRARVIAIAFVLVAAGLVSRVVYLHVNDGEFLLQQADARHIREVSLNAHRGSILDRNGEPLAVSTPVDSIWLNPKEISKHLDRLGELASTLEKNETELGRYITSRTDREFIYLSRHITPREADRILALDIPGVYRQREYRRFYPAGEVTGHVLGFSDIDDVGQEGIERVYDHFLRGTPGSKRVVQDLFGRHVADIESIAAAKPGKDLTLSLDLRLQYVAYRALKSAVQSSQAKSGSLVVLDVNTREVLAMVNQPSFNPNSIKERKGRLYRNRAVTDIFEPGSSMKPLIVAAALESGKYDAKSRVDTSPGYFDVGITRIKDHSNLGNIDLATVLARSSNVGIAKIALQLDSEQLWQTLSAFGFGQLTASGFPGESAGVLVSYEHWRELAQATLGYGYGMSLTPVQLAQAYAVIGQYGEYRPVSFTKIDHSPPTSRRVFSEETGRTLVDMLEKVVGPEGTAQSAAIEDYRVVGKTGTARKVVDGQYSEAHITAVFAGLAPKTQPRIAIVVLIDEPQGEANNAGDVAAPVFAKVMRDSLRMLAVKPDAVDSKFVVSDLSKIRLAQLELVGEIE